jgi:tetratricopeptide (TPR) repeat protein
MLVRTKTMILAGLALCLVARAEQVRVAVLDFSVPAVESNRWTWAEAGVADLLQIELQQQGLDLLDRDSIHAVLAEQRLATSGRMAENSLTIAKLLNVRFLITGKVIPLAGERFRVEASVFSVETVETAVSAAGEGNFPKDLSQVVQQVANQIAKKLPARSGFSAETQPPIRAPKPEALIHFYRGLNACAAGQPEWGAAYFINAASLDPDFTVPLLWEIKAYEMAGLPQFADIRRQELVPLLGTNAIVTPAIHTTNAHPRPVLALLDPMVGVQTEEFDAASLAGGIKQALLADNRVRLFAFEGIGAAVAEQDLRLSSFFTSQNAPRYGRWLTADALVFCHIKPAETGKVEIELSLINPVNASVMARVQRVQSATTLPSILQSLTRELLALWLKQPKAATARMTTLETFTTKAKGEYPDLRPIYRDLANALGAVQQEPGKSDLHRSLANAFGATGRPRLAAFEIEQCLKRLDIHAPHADTTYLGTHRWLFWEPSPASSAAGLVNPAAITNLIGQLLSVYPNSLAAGCMRYNLAVTAWQSKDWPEAVTQAKQSRQFLQSLVAHYDRDTQTGANRGEVEFEMIAATFFVEGASLRESGKREESRLVFHQGLDFMQTFKVRNFCLPLGPYIGDFFGPERVYGCGGNPPGIRTRLEQELVAIEGKPFRPLGLNLPEDAADLVSATNAPNRTAENWLQCAEQIVGMMDGATTNAAEDFRSLLGSGGTCLSKAREKGADTSKLRMAADKLVSTFKTKKIFTDEKSFAESESMLVETAKQIQSVYTGAGLKTDTWQQIEPLLNPPYPVELHLDLLQQMSWEPERFAQELSRATDRVRAEPTNAATAWLKLGQTYFQKQRYLETVDCYQQAVARGVPVMSCPGLATALLEIALERNVEHPADEIEKLRNQRGLPPIQASWVEWFGTGRKFQTARQFDLEKAVACYRGAMDFLEHPEQRGVYRLEKEPCCERWNLRWGLSIGEVDLRWTQKYDERWYSAAFYLAHCLIKLNRKEEAALWLRQIAIKVGGDSGIPLLERDTWNSSGWSSANLGVRSAELLQDLHVVKKRVAIGLMDGPYKLPPRIDKAIPLSVPPLPPVDATLLQPLTNALIDAGKTRISRERKERLQPVIAEHGHQLVPVALSFLYQEPCPWDKSLIVLILEQTADTNDAPWVVNAITREYGLIKLAQRLDPKTTTSVLAEEWQRQEANNFISPWLIKGIVEARVRPFYALVLDQIAEVKENHWSDVFLMDGVVAQDNSPELKAAFCEAVAQCLKQKLLVGYHYQIGRIAHVALRYGIPEGIDGVRVSEEASAEQLRAFLKPYLDLPSNDAELVSFLRQNHGLWRWNPDTKRFELPAMDKH